jgi:hypothetical protein
MPLNLRSKPDKRGQVPISVGVGDRARHNHDCVPSEVGKDRDIGLSTGEMLCEGVTIRTTGQIGAIQQHELEWLQHRVR